MFNMFKTPELRKNYSNNPMDEPVPRRGRSSENFLMFCKMILDYENYEESSREDLLRRRHTSSPLGSTGSGAESNMSSSQEESLGLESPTQRSNVIVSDEDSGTLLGTLSGTLLGTLSDDEDDVTCYCKKPYGGRPMIECSCCSTWVHLACAKVKRTAIPDMWYCALCKTKSTKGGAKARARARARKGSSSQALLAPSSTSMKRKT